VAERTWLHREEIAEIHEVLAERAQHKMNLTTYDPTDEFEKALDEVMTHKAAAETLRNMHLVGNYIPKQFGPKAVSRR